MVKGSAQNFKTEAAIKLWKSLHPYLLQQVGKCNLLLERGSTRKATQKEIVVSPTPEEHSSSSRVPGQRILTDAEEGTLQPLHFLLMGSEDLDKLRTKQTQAKKHRMSFFTCWKRGKPIFVTRGEKKSHFWEHTVRYLLDSLFIWLFNSVHDFSHVFRCLVLIFSQLTNCLKVWVFWSNI